MSQRYDVHPLGAIAFSENGGFGDHIRIHFIKDYAHALQCRACTDDIIQNNNLFALNKCAVFLVQDQKLRLAGVVLDGKTVQIDL